MTQICLIPQQRMLTAWLHSRFPATAESEHRLRSHLGSLVPARVVRRLLLLRAREAGLEVYVTLAYTPEWVPKVARPRDDDYTGNDEPVGSDEWVTFVEAAVRPLVALGATSVPNDDAADEELGTVGCVAASLRGTAAGGGIGASAMPWGC